MGSFTQANVKQQRKNQGPRKHTSGPMAKQTYSRFGGVTTLKVKKHRLHDVNMSF